MMRRTPIAPLALAVLLFFSGCGPSYYISQHLLATLPALSRVTVADLKDDLPTGQNSEKRPTSEQIEKFRDWILEALINRGMFTDTSSTSASIYQVEPTLRDFEKGSGVGRFFFGGGMGFDGEMSVRIQLINRTTKEVLFVGDFKAKAQGWAETSGSSFQKIAQDFANALKKDLKSLEAQKNR